jgi:elongation factor G
MIEPRFAADTERLVSALTQMASNDASFGYSRDPNSGQLIARVADEQCLDVTVDILKRKYGIEVKLGLPQVAYRETLARPVEVDYTHKRPVGPRGEFARVKLRLEPNEPGAGNQFQDETVGGVVPKEYIPGVETGVQSVWDSGVLGSPLIDTRVTIYDGAFHEVDSSPIAFKIAACAAMREGAAKAGIKLLEPIMDLELVSPSNFVRSVIDDLNNRRGHICDQETRGSASVLRANAPLAHLFGYKSSLSLITNGLGSCTIRFSHYAELPRTNGPDDFRPAVGMRA